MTLRQLLSLVRAHLLLIIVIPICFALASWAIVSVVPKDYVVQSTVLIPVSEQMAAADRNMTAGLTRVANGSVAHAALISRHPDIDVDELVIEATKPDESDVIVIDVTGASREDASVIANELASYICDYTLNTLDKEGVEIISYASPDTSSASPSPLKYAVEFAVLGLLVAIVVIIIRAQKKGTIV